MSALSYWPSTDCESVTSHVNRRGLYQEVFQDPPGIGRQVMLLDDLDRIAIGLC